MHPRAARSNRVGWHCATPVGVRRGGYWYPSAMGVMAQPAIEFACVVYVCWRSIWGGHHVGTHTRGGASWGGRRGPSSKGHATMLAPYVCRAALPVPPCPISPSWWLCKAHTWSWFVACSNQASGWQWASNYTLTSQVSPITRVCGANTSVFSCSTGWHSVPYMQCRHTVERVTHGSRHIHVAALCGRAGV